MNRTTSIDRIRIQGFRSLANVDVKLPRVAVLIGANGSGKSNFIRFFELLNCMASRRLGEFVARQGGADDQLFGGSKITSSIKSTLYCDTVEGKISYDFILRHAQPDSLIVTREVFKRPGRRSGISLEFPTDPFNHPRREPKLGEFRHASRATNRNSMGSDFASLLYKTNVFQFHDTSDSSRVKQRWDIEDNQVLRGDAGNLASLLLYIQRNHPRNFYHISRQIGRILPQFHRFQIDENYGKAMLRWKPKRTEKTIGPHLTSDGSLRFFALVTLLNLPKAMLPRVLLIDEPELGLHPVAIELISNMVMQISDDCQVILATQSPLLIDYFGLERTIVLDILDGCTEPRVLKEQDYELWLADYVPSTLWHKNLLGGRP